MQTEENLNFEEDAFSDSFEYDMYYDEAKEKTDYIFSLSVLQITLCILMALMLFIMSFFGSFKEKTGEAVEYFKSFELTKNDITDELAAMKSFLSDDKI